MERFEDFHLPAGTRLFTRLVTQVDSQRSPVGSPVEAELTNRVKLSGGREVPKGALLNGRIRRLERYTDGPPRTVVGLEFTTLTFGNRRAQLFLELNRVNDSSRTASRQGPPASVNQKMTMGGVSGSPITTKTSRPAQNRTCQGSVCSSSYENSFNSAATFA